jgi:hypothetical protein
LEGFTEVGGSGFARERDHDAAMADHVGDDAQVLRVGGEMALDLGAIGVIELAVDKGGEHCFDVVGFFAHLNAFS